MTERLKKEAECQLESKTQARVAALKLRDLKLELVFSAADLVILTMAAMELAAKYA